MTYYSKLIAAIVGVLVILAGRYGLDLESQQVVITDLIGTVIAWAGVYFAKNKPVTEEQVAKAREIANEGAKKVHDA
jgi:uncharacterized membrane protein (DUF441 family)